MISKIVILSLILVYNFINSLSDKKKKLIITNLLNFNLTEYDINIILTSIIRLIFIFAYFFFAIPVIIDFIIGTLQLIIRIIKKDRITAK